MNKLKNIIILNDYDFINGGTSQIAIGTANAMAETGLNVIFFSAVSNPTRNDLSPKVTRINTGQFDILSNPDRLGAMKQGIWNKKAAAGLSDILKKVQPSDTVIHLHGWSKALSASIGSVLEASSFPVICTLHDYFIACPNGGFYNYKKNQICTLKPMHLACICTNCDARNYAQKIWRVVRQEVQSVIGKMPKGIKNYITVSDFSRKVLAPYLPDIAKIFTIGNPVNVDEKPERANVYTKRALCIGRLSPEKGISIACEAARLSKTPLTVIGDGALMEALSTQYPEVEFKGWLQPAEVFAEIRNASVLIFSSLLYETQGLAVLEALSYGLPAIVSDQCAASEFIDGKNGVLFEIGNPNDLAEKLRFLFSDLAVVETMSNYAYAKYWDNPFTMKKYIRELEATFQEILLNNAAK